MKIQLSDSSIKVLGALIENTKPLYVNEIIRKTSLYPNSVQRSLETLKKQKILISEEKGNKKFYSINPDHRFIDAIKLIVARSGRKAGEQVVWIKFVNRDVSVAINDAIGKSWSSRKYMSKFKLKPLVYLWYNSVTGGSYGVLEEIVRSGKEISENIKKDNSYAKFLAESCIKDGKDLVSSAKKTLTGDLTVLSSKDLHEKLLVLYEKYKIFMPHFAFPHSVEEAVQKEIENLVPAETDRQKLLEPTAVVSDEQKDELDLAQFVKDKGWDKENKLKLAKLTERYCWMPMMNLQHKPFNIKYFKAIIDKLSEEVNGPGKRLLDLEAKEVERNKELKNTLRKLKADKYLTSLVETAQSYIKLRTFRTNTVAKFHFYHLPLLWEIATRLKLSNEEIVFLTYDEILGLLTKGSVDPSNRSEIEKRKEGFANITWKGSTSVISGVENIIHAIEQYGIVAETPPAKDIVKGNPANRGVVTGRVKVIKKLEQLGKVKKGDILVAKMTSPDYVVAINKASAIVTDEGGITSHAAIISREYDIPCIVGTKNASQVLSDEDLVEVNANEGVVRIVQSVDVSEDVKVFKGKRVYRGKVKGTARIILDASDFKKMQDGDIIITPQTTPEYLSLLYRAKGFVVDEDSITSHEVLYGRALELPSIMGTKNARSVIKDGEKIELDSGKGIVKRLKNG